METFGPPLIFLTPNLADTQHPLLLVVQGEEVDLGSVDQEMDPSLPKYRDMLRKIAQDPVAQTVQFEFLMRLFFQHVLNVRPERWIVAEVGSARSRGNGAVMAPLHLLPALECWDPCLPSEVKSKLKAAALCIHIFWFGLYAAIWRW
jgi:hypothetical protein